MPGPGVGLRTEFAGHPGASRSLHAGGLQCVRQSGSLGAVDRARQLRAASLPWRAFAGGGLAKARQGREAARSWRARSTAPKDPDCRTHCSPPACRLQCVRQSGSLGAVDRARQLRAKEGKRRAVGERDRRPPKILIAEHTVACTLAGYSVFGNQGSLLLIALWTCARRFPSSARLCGSPPATGAMIYTIKTPKGGAVPSVRVSCSPARPGGLGRGLIITLLLMIQSHSCARCPRG